MHFSQQHSDDTILQRIMKQTSVGVSVRACREHWDASPYIWQLKHKDEEQREASSALSMTERKRQREIVNGLSFELETLIIES